ncbi:cytosolic iron-sulfur assembly component 2A-like [Pollicipes pollicipes]|uniref:LOW QUALITY PROTEIN: cytosolic iron-sulfur assembly component 2A-like n=1 Tax=Pollicipes pollicipes TaxID=41117 RepID=UPI001885053E|nr:LOW QUALITY PROTEIN: cytosolic iron-sulfur assembly component 2A-like [Pollicipes pollicipes]XP_037081102.1 cytosolic iron-sulfur assembly component 2A-like [Pollicipes pollicipes]XP_037081103.1 cytosolic iron-sulfur assembly component 2A-like [Pollicipes pollicipes]XP_037081104.1 cytosolic iron-sulfur assembly component 2A-like [Pollicipes pollicipes]XP_037081105.1 cytosolic iron-sulfur assembly component 2A-like [Pollicipes pollicipes]
MSLVETAKEADHDCQDKVEQVYDLIRCIEDPEKSASLEDLRVVSEDDVAVSRFPGVGSAYYVRVQLTPTVPHCSLATLIGLCVRVRLQENLDFEHKLDVVIKEGSHQTSGEVSKQINDKERVAAAMENPGLLSTVRRCIRDPE